MHFGKKLLALRYEPWGDHYLDYNQLKGVLERGDNDDNDKKEETTSSSDIVVINPGSGNNINNPSFLSRFDEQVESVVFFALQQQGLIASQLALLRREQRQPALALSPSSAITLYRGLHDVAADLLHLIQFVDLNVMAIRKILKKHDKITTGTQLSWLYLGRKGQRENHHYDQQQSNHRPVLQPLFEHGGLDALIQSLEDALDNMSSMNTNQHDVPLQKAFFRSNTTPEHSDSGHGTLQSQADAVAEKELRLSLRQTITSVDDSASSPSSRRDAMILVHEIEAARRQLQQTRDFVHMLAAQMLLQPPGGATADEGPAAVIPDEKRRISNFLNLMSTFLHLTDYYIVAPGCGTYAEKLGGTASLAGLIIGMNSVAALMSTVLYSWWTSYSYKAPLVCASACSVIGDVIYAIALPCGSLKLVMLGRLFSGFGSARALNRRYIADTYPARERTAASAAFVSAGALGTSAGPAIAACFYFAVPDSSDSLFWQVENSPCWFMALLYVAYLVCLFRYFEEPPRPPPEPKKSYVEMGGGTTDEKKALLEGDISSRTSLSDASSSSQPLWENVPVMTTFAIYFALKFILESLLSSTATLSNFYFDWNGSFAGMYLAVLGLLVLPANWVVASVAHMYDDRELIVALELFMLTGCLAILKYTDSYTAVQYVIASVTIFVSTNALEGPTMSLLSKTIPAAYSRGLLNVGLLATEAGTLGRAVGDVILSVCGANGLEYVLNNAFGFMSALSLATIGLTWRFYGFMEPLEKDD